MIRPSFAPGFGPDSTTRDQAYDDQSSNLYPLLPSSVVVQHLKGNEPTIFQGVKHIRVWGVLCINQHCALQIAAYGLDCCRSPFHDFINCHNGFLILLYNWRRVGMPMARCLHYMPSSALLSLRSADKSVDVSTTTVDNTCPPHMITVMRRKNPYEFVPDSMKSSSLGQAERTDFSEP